VTFAAPLWLTMLALLPLVALLHVRRRDPIEVASTRLWRLVTEGERPETRLRLPPPSLALFLQLLAVVVLSVALAQPRLGWSERGPTVIVVDASIATAFDDGTGHSVHTVTTDMLADELRRWDAPWSLWRVSDDARPVLLDHASIDGVRHALVSSHPEHLPADWDAAAERILREVGDRGRMIVLASDAVAAERALELVHDRGAWSLDIRSLAAPSFTWGVDALEVHHDDARRGRWHVEALVRPLGEPGDERPSEAVVRFLPDLGNEPIDLERVELAYTLAGTARVRASVDATRPGILSVEIVGGDAFVADDAAAVRIDPEPPRARVGVYGPASDGTTRVLAAVRSLGYDVADVRDAEIVIVTDAPPPSALESRSVLWIGTTAQTADPNELQRHDASVALWRPEHPTALHTHWPRIEASVALELPLPADADVVVAGVSVPLVAARTSTERREVWTAFTAQDPAWVAGPEFVSFLGDALRWFEPPPRHVSWCVVGGPCEVPREVAVGGGRVDDAFETVARWPTSAATLPADVTRAWHPTRAGVVSWQVGERGAPDAEPASARLAVRLSAASVSALASAVQATPSDGGPPRIDLPDLRVWVVLAGIVIVLESVLAGRGRERFWHLQAWRGRGLLARRRRAIALWSTAAVVALIAAASTLPLPLSWSARQLVVVGDVPDDVEHAVARVQRVEPNPHGGAIDAEAALRSAVALAGGQPSDIVWNPDAPATRGSVAIALTNPAFTPYVVHAFGPAARPSGDVSVELISADRTPFAGGSAVLSAVLHANEATDVELLVFRDDELVVERTASLATGATLVRIPVSLPEPGVQRWRVTVHADGDPFPGNDTAELALDVRASPRVWVMTDERERGQSFADALELQGFRSVVRPSFAVPTDLAAFQDVDLVVLSNVPALELTSLQQDTLEAWVRERGGGLVITGGERSFGPGGYLETPLDALSPLSSRVPRDAPEVAIAFVLDRSGSMQQQVGGATRLDIAKEATLRAVELLGDESDIAIVVFDQEATLLLPWTSVSDLSTIEAALGPLVPGGGTSIAAGLEMAIDVVAQSLAASLHVVVMTDGLSQPGDFAGLTRELRDRDATVSAVAIGLGADVDVIREIASVGGGAAHITTDFRALPGILAQEALLLSGDPVVHEVLTPRQVDVTHPVMAQLPTVFPPMTAFVETTPKLDADVLLVDGEDRPLLAVWRYGAGQVMAFPSHAVGPWTDAWTAVDAFPLWWGQWLRSLVQDTVQSGLTLTTTVAGDELHVRVDAFDDDGRTRGGLDLEARLTSADGTLRTRLLADEGDGRYTARLALGTGTSEVVVIDRGDDGRPSVSARVAHAYPATWSASAGDAARTIAAWTGGHLDPAQLALPTARGMWISGWNPAWRPWLAGAVLAWMVTLLLRYVPGWLRMPRRAGADVRAEAPFRSRRATASPD